MQDATEASRSIAEPKLGDTMTAIGLLIFKSNVRLLLILCQVSHLAAAQNGSLFCIYLGLTVSFVSVPAAVQ